jgi:hypothetical protein
MTLKHLRRLLHNHYCGGHALQQSPHAGSSGRGHSHDCGGSQYGGIGYIVLSINFLAEIINRFARL